MRLRLSGQTFALHLAASLVLAILPVQANAIDCGHVLLDRRSSLVCRVDVRKEPLRLFLNDAAGNRLQTFAAINKVLGVHGERLTFAMNAGMFHPGHAPVGLFIDGGQEIAPLNTSNGRGNFFLEPNGVFYVGRSGPAVVETSQFLAVHDEVTLATQSGPLLVHGGIIHPGLLPKSTSRLIRNGVGIDRSGTAVFAISDDPMSLHEFARLFLEKLGCQEALYFDGTVSSVYVPALQLNIQRANLGPIIGVVE